MSTMAAATSGSAASTPSAWASTPSWVGHDDYVGAGPSIVEAAAAELYSADPDGFVARRKELAAQARAAGDAAAAKQITALGKPTKSAWLVNRLVRTDPSVPARLAELAGQLRANATSLDGAS